MCLQAYIKKELGKVVVYTTTSGIVRKTFYNCKKVKQILRTHMVKYDELDLFGDAELQTELRDRLGSTVIQLPQLFIDGQHIGVSKFNYIYPGVLRTISIIIPLLKTEF